MQCPFTLYTIDANFAYLITMFPDFKIMYCAFLSLPISNLYGDALKIIKNYPASSSMLSRPTLTMIEHQLMFFVLSGIEM